MTSCLILAAGNGSRMKLNCPKVLAEVLNSPMLSWVLDSVTACNIEQKCVVTGYASDKVEKFLKSHGYFCEIAFQAERKGTAHAVISAENFLNKNLDGDVLILGGDSPFVDVPTIMSSYKQHKNDKNSVTIISAKFGQPFGYGRIVRDSDGNVCSIVEEKEANEEEKKINEINSGAYWFKVRDLLNAVKSIKESTLSGEFYLTSIISIFINNKLSVGAFCASDYTVALGANTIEQLRYLNFVAKSKLIESFISKGVNIPHIDKVNISKNVEIGAGTTILPDVTINAFTRIGKNCSIGPGVVLSGEYVPDNTNLDIENLNLYVESQKVKSGEINAV